MKLAPSIATMTRIPIPRWRVFGAACLAHVLHDGCSSMLYLLLPFWQTELALSLTEVGILKTVYSAAMAIGQVPAGRLGERWSERLPLVAGTFLTAAAVFALHWAATPLVLGLLLSIGGLGASVQHPLASTLISKVYGGSALRVKLGTYNFAGDLGKMLIPAVLTILIAAFGWRSGTMSIGVLGLATAAILLIALPPRAHDPAPEGRHQTPRRPLLAEPLRRRSFAVLSVVGMLDSATRTGLLTFLPFILARKGADTAVVGAALSLVFAGGAVGKFACGALATQVGILRIVAATELGTALAILGGGGGGGAARGAAIRLPVADASARHHAERHFLGALRHGARTYADRSRGARVRVLLHRYYRCGRDGTNAVRRSGRCRRSLRHDSAGRRGCFVDPAFARCASARRPRAQTPTLSSGLEKHPRCHSNTAMMPMIFCASLPLWPAKSAPPWQMLITRYWNCSREAHGARRNTITLTSGVGICETSRDVRVVPEMRTIPDINVSPRTDKNAFLMKSDVENNDMVKR